MGCVVTGPGRMECDYIIHAVGPICFSRENMAKKDKELAAAVLNSLLKAEELELRSISLPGTLFSLSLSILSYPFHVSCLTSPCALARSTTTQPFRAASSGTRRSGAPR